MPYELKLFEKVKKWLKNFQFTAQHCFLRKMQLGGLRKKTKVYEALWLMYSDCPSRSSFYPSPFTSMPQGADLQTASMGLFALWLQLITDRQETRLVGYFLS